ncbi:hypothetical protein, partial [Piscirickettsia litoralis]|uniref:hypothetical protein n=1 Tax=Piscirickettsia litoralis TaxID=1891921 RepID=UPI001912F5F0
MPPVKKPQLASIKNLDSEVPPLLRWNSAPNLATKKIAPDVRMFDTLRHPISSLNAKNPGTVIFSRNSKDEWSRIPLTPNSILQNIEVRPSKGLMNLTGSMKFTTGELNQTQKRDLQRVVTSIIMAYNSIAKEKKAPLISIHENHFIGDGEIYENRNIPRLPNEMDYDYYHTLGVNFSDNGIMMPHYHLEFDRPLSKNNVRPILESLQKLGKEALKSDILGVNEISTILEKLPDGDHV